MALRLKEQIIKEHKKDALFYFGQNQRQHTTPIAIKKVVKVNWEAEILYATDVSLCKHISGINKPADIGTRGIKIECMLEQVSVYAIISLSVIIKKAEEWKAAIQWNRFNNFNRLVLQGHMDNKH